MNPRVLVISIRIFHQPVTVLPTSRNKGKDFNLLSLYIKDLQSDGMVSLDLQDVQAAPLLVHTCAFGHKVKAGVGRAFDWHPDGEHMVYVRRKDTPEGYLYADLYTINLDTKKSERLTHRQRATAPAYSPDGNQIAFVGQSDGSTNLFVLDAASGSIRQLTAYDDGSQVTDPAWHPEEPVIYFGLQHTVGRDIYRIGVDTAVPEPVVATAHDERSPAFDDQGMLYFASDQTGIYNIYRKDLANEGSVAQVTNVVGGAFMPDVHGDQLVYASYAYDGYKIGYFDQVPPGTPASAATGYAPPAAIVKEAVGFTESAEATRLNGFDDTDLSSPSVTAIRGAQGIEQDASDEEGETLAITPYKNQFTSWSIYPVLRLDQYVSRRAAYPRRTAGRPGPARNADAQYKSGYTGVFARGTRRAQHLWRCDGWPDIPRCVFGGRFFLTFPAAQAGTGCVFPV